MKRLLAFLLCAAMLLSFAACAGKNGTEESAEETLAKEYENLEEDKKGTDEIDFSDTTVSYKDEIVIGSDAALVTLDPHSTPTTSTADYVMMAYDRLINYNENTSEFEPELATSWEWISATELQLKLRDDVYFSDGSKFTAEDVVYSFERMLNDTTIAAKLTAMDKVEAVDEYTVKFTLNVASVDFLFNISTYYMCIVSKAACEADPENGYLVTTGAWIVEDFTPSDHYTLKVNENYWGDVPVTKKITVNYMAEATARLIALQNGEIDICLRVSEEEAEYVKEDANLALTVIPANTCIYFGFNTSEGPGSDINFRLALAYCLNKEEIIMAAANGYGQVAVTNWGLRTYGHDESFGDYEQNLELAKEYLSKSAYDTITVMVRGSKTRDVNALTVIQEQARQIGMNIIIDAAENANLTSATQFDTHSHEAVVYSYGWSLYGDDSRMPYYINSNVNKAHVTNQEIMDLIDAAAVEQDDTLRKEMYAKVQLINHENAYYLPLFYSVVFQGINKDLNGAIWGSAVNDFTYVCVPTAA